MWLEGGSPLGPKKIKKHIGIYSFWDSKNRYFGEWFGEVFGEVFGKVLERFWKDF